MIDAADPAARAARASARAEAILEPGRNCWRMERADRFGCVQDGADYFRFVREALLGARDTVFILGWDILAGVDLQPETTASEAPTRLSELLAFVVRRRPEVRCYILVWDYAALYTLERDPFSRWRLGWATPRQVRFGFDDRHPLGGSHHQKIVVVDDQLAFCGSIDLTGHRWDTSAHRIDEPARTTALGGYDPYHEIQAMVSGPCAAALGVLARDRWRALGGGERMPPVGKPLHDLWPPEATPDLVDVHVAIARTVPESERQPAIRECEALVLDSIAAAGQTIYIETQYFTNDVLAEALAAKLREPRGPEIVVVTPIECDGWLDRNTMGALRRRAFQLLVAADVHGRLRLMYPVASRARNVPTFVHSKVVIVDDRLVRIGSANFSRRSMGVDTECDLAAEAGDDVQARAGIRDIRNRLVAEHLGLTGGAVARGVERAGSLRAFIDERRDADRALLPLQAITACAGSPLPEAMQALADPDEPIGFGASVTALVPPVDATYQNSPLRLRLLRAVVIAAALASTASVLVGRLEFSTVQDALGTLPTMRGILWIGLGLFLVANLLLVPLESTAVAAGLLLGWPRGGAIALVGSLGAATVGYVAGRALGPASIGRWMSRQSYRSGRQLGARGVIGVLVLRLASVASAGSIHLLCGAARVPFASYIAGTALALAPASAALSGLGALLRQALIRPSVSSWLTAMAAALFLIALASALRSFLLLRQFAPSASRHRERAQFG
jgi:phosphatidylserine/phosphatidylglycerophosphate/cardiolipin synthase-like enzyme/uncharacterized membrane protein YdjX (TVP38/TMEM64 family)